MLFVCLSMFVSAVEMTPSVQWAAVVSDRSLDKRMGVENISLFFPLLSGDTKHSEVQNNLANS